MVRECATLLLYTYIACLVCEHHVHLSKASFHFNGDKPSVSITISEQFLLLRDYCVIRCLQYAAFLGHMIGMLTGRLSGEILSWTVYCPLFCSLLYYVDTVVCKLVCKLVD